ncbi:rod shape-determining protein [Spiroplasma endosymbiont of Amphibalanus improvisus]|uniref:rod shape-determining protein n=1 Tax=Spiroplasma endosymbiont of Amphibalanus improvisus TaxID=3066327 RepID=UPI00313B0BB5
MKQPPLYVGMDLGTSSTLVYVEGSGIVYNEPSVVAYNIKENRIVAIGNEAYKMIGKGNKSIRIVFPMKNGVIQDIRATRSQLNYIFSFKLKLMSRLKDSIMLLACPSMITPLEKKALEQIANSFGAKKVFVEEEVKMAALGGGVDIYKPQGSLVIDIGGGTTDIAVIASGDIVISKSTKVAGSFLNDEIVKYIRSKYGLEIGNKTSEQIKKEIGSAFRYSDEKNMSIYGRDIVSGLPRTASISPAEIREVLIVQLSKILDCAVEVLEKTPPELAGDIFQKGMVICGGGALIRGIDKYFTELLKLPAIIGEQPLLAVVNGTKKFEYDIKTRIKELKQKTKMNY